MTDLKTVLTETLRPVLDDSALAHLGRSLGDLGSGHVIEDVIDALLRLPGVAVTQLPEPDDDHGDGIAFWTDQEVGVADGMVVARFDPGSETIYYEPRAAKALAAALLAAAGVFSEGATND